MGSSQLCGRSSCICCGGQCGQGNGTLRSSWTRCNRPASRTSLCARNGARRTCRCDACRQREGCRVLGNPLPTMQNCNPHLNKLWKELTKEFGAEKIQFIGVSKGEEAEPVKTFITGMNGEMEY